MKLGFNVLGSSTGLRSALDFMMAYLRSSKLNLPVIFGLKGFMGIPRASQRIYYPLLSSNLKILPLSRFDQSMVELNVLFIRGLTSESPKLPLVSRLALSDCFD